MRALWLMATVVCAMLALSPARAVQPDEMLKDPALESRARDLSRELRCMVCQNQSIDDSDASLARDLRLLVRERLVAGDSNDQVLKFLTDRYGDFVLLRPRFTERTALLWILPPLFVLAGAGALVALLRRQKRITASSEAVALSESERARVEEIVAKR